MRAYILSEQDIKDLTDQLARDPRRGVEGGSSSSLSPEQVSAYDDAYRFYNYIVRRWIDKIKSDPPKI